ncbi:MAG: type II secretion system protein GspN, partial [Proteobacteria bacterium]
MKQLKLFFASLRRSKFKISVMIFSTFAFLIWLFPFNDLGDLVSTQVARLTGNKLFLQFEELKMSLIPTPGMRFQQVYVEATGFSGISAQEIKFTPSIGGLIMQKPYGTVNAKGLLKGDVQISVKGGPRSDGGLERQKIEVTAQKLNLQDLREVARIPVMMKGKLDFDTTSLVDLTFAEQPDVEITLSISQFELPPANEPTPMGPITMPDLKLSSVEIKGRLAAGKLIIESGTIGREADELRGTITGNIDITLTNMGGGVTPVVGGYDFRIDLRAKRNFQERAALFLSFIDNYKTALPDGGQYRFRVNATNTSPSS